MVRLLSIQPVAERGGSDQALVRLLRSLPPTVFECHVAVPAEPPMRPELDALGARVHVVPMRRISTSHSIGGWLAYALAWPGAVARLVRIIKAERIDVVHTNSLHSWYGWAAAALTRRPHVWHAREIVVQSGAALAVERFLTRHFATRVVAASHAIAAQLDSRNVVVLHEHVDGVEFAPARAGTFRVAAGIAEDAPLVGTVGRIDTWKGVDVVLDAFARARARDGRLELIVAGAPVAGKEDYARALAARAAGIGGVHWLGERDDVPAVMADLDVFVLASTAPEPYGLVVVEALASGAPVIATDGGGAREIAEAAPPGAVTLVPPGDAGALAQAIATVLARPGAQATETTATSASGRATTRQRSRRPVLAPPPDRLDFAAILATVTAARSSG